MDLFVHDQSFVAFGCAESCPERAVFVSMCCEWFDGVSESLETVRRRMQLACRFSYPANDYLAFAVGEAGDSTREVRREALLHFVQSDWRQRLAFKRARPARKHDR